MNDSTENFPKEITEEEYLDMVENAKNKDWIALDSALMGAAQAVISCHRRLQRDGVTVVDNELKITLDKLAEAVKNRNNLEHMLKSVKWFEEYTRNR